MAKIGASLANVSTDFQDIMPGVYRWQITDVTEHPGKAEQGGGATLQYRVKSKILGLAEGGDTDEKNRVFVDFIDLNNRKDGSSNQYGLVQLKRYFEAVLGADVVAERGDDLDTDELKGQYFDGELAIRTYESKKETNPDGTPVMKSQNVLKSIVPVA